MKKFLSVLALASTVLVGGCTEKTKIIIEPEAPVYVVEEELTETYETIKHSVVYIYSYNDQEFEAGSGVVFKESEDFLYILTNKHVVGVMTSFYEEYYENFEVKFFDGTVASAQIVGSLNELDVAVLKIAKEDCGHYVVATQTTEYSVGETVVAYGNPLQIPFVMTSGIVSNKDSAIDFSANGLGLYYGIQTDASINPGSSGGGLFNADGELIGITQGCITNRNGIGYAIPILYANHVANYLISIEYFDLQEYGFDYVDLSEADVEISSSITHGVYVTSGEHQGQIVTHVNGMLIKDSIRMYMYRFLLDSVAICTFVNPDGSVVE
jgi:S1-C subfamily serine protease